MKILARLVSLQTRRPALPLLFVAAITAFFAAHAARLTLRTQFDVLLPENAPSVVELHRLEKRTPVSQTVLVLLEGGDRDVLHRMGDDLVTELRGLETGVVSRAEDGTRDARDFLLPRSALFLSQRDLDRLRTQVDDRWDYEVQKSAGTLLDEDEPPPPLPTVESLRGDSARVDRFPSGYYENASETALVVAAHSPVAGGDLPRVEHALDAMRAAVARVQAASPERARIRVSYAGDMPTAFAEYHVVLGDLLGVGATGIALILAAVLLYYMRARALLVMGASIAVALIWTFGATQLFIGHLNVATAFLVSIVAGNGLNVGILYQARYFEERARGVEPVEAIRLSVVTTWQPTVIAALAAAASYGSLLVTDFRAFRDFGLIAATGMLMCWIVKTLLVPPLLLLSERLTPRRAGWLSRCEMTYGRPFAWLSTKSPRWALAAAGLVIVTGIGAAARYASGDVLDYDTRTLETTDANNASLQRAWRICNEILGSSQGAMVIAADSAGEADVVATTLRARYDAAPEGRKPFSGVHTLGDFVPSDQPAKLESVRDLGDKLRRAQDRGFVSAADWQRLSPMLPPEGLEPFGIADLPASIAAPFTERDGTRGTLVLVEPVPGASNDMRSLLALADAYRTTTLPNGKVVYGTGSAVIFADILGAVVRDVPRSLLLSFAFTLAVVVVTFRKRTSELWAVLFAFATAVAGVMIYLALAGVKINFLNFAALPVTFGIGVDYAVNVAQRRAADGERDMSRVLRTTGGAVVLCSLTTFLGYLALVGSHNRAIRSLGTIAAVGEVCCLLAAVIIVPAWFSFSAIDVTASRASAAGSPRSRA